MNRAEAATKDRTGERHGRLVVIRRVTSAPGIVWLCRCDCGRWPEVTFNSANSRHYCGCLKREAATRREATRREQRTGQ